MTSSRASNMTKISFMVYGGQKKTRNTIGQNLIEKQKTNRLTDYQILLLSDSDSSHKFKKLYKSQAKSIQRKPSVDIQTKCKTKNKEKSFQQPENERHATFIRAKIILTANLLSTIMEAR